MRERARVAILGTGQVAVTPAEHGGSAVDPLVDAVIAQRSGGGATTIDRERALLLRAGGDAVVRRAAFVPETSAAPVDRAGDETLSSAHPRLRELLGSLFAGTDEPVLAEALERMTRARIRIPEELLPSALSRTSASVRERVRPVLGARGAWLAQRRSEWQWAIVDAASAELPADVEARWQEGSAAERRVLLAQVRAIDPARGRALIESTWKHDKADQRAMWIAVMGLHLTQGDEPLLSTMLGDRSGPVRLGAARLGWRLPESAIAARMRAAADALLSWDGRLEVALPAEPLDRALEKDGIVETAPHGIGRRQWWLAQLISAVPPEHWTARFGVDAATLVQAARGTEVAEALIDGLTAAALRHDTRGFYAPLWDAWTASTPRLEARVSETPHAALSARLAPSEAAPRMHALLRALLDGRERNDLLAHFARPWPHDVARAVVEGLSRYRRTWISVLPIAALAVPVELLPATTPVPEVPDHDYAASIYLRALDQFQHIATIRRAIAEEIPT